VNAPIFVPKFANAAAAQREVVSPPPPQATEAGIPEMSVDAQAPESHEEIGYAEEGNGYANGQPHEEYADHGLGQQEYGYHDGYDYQVDHLGNGLQGLEIVRFDLFSSANFMLKEISRRRHQTTMTNTIHTRHPTITPRLFFCGNQ
jgi:hypothetical protein